MASFKSPLYRVGVEPWRLGFSRLFGSVDWGPCLWKALSALLEAVAQRQRCAGRLRVTLPPSRRKAEGLIRGERSPGTAGWTRHWIAWRRAFPLPGSGFEGLPAPGTSLPPLLLSLFTCLQAPSGTRPHGPAPTRAAFPAPACPGACFLPKTQLLSEEVASHLREGT